jgi:hypothetical protein
MTLFIGNIWQNNSWVPTTIGTHPYTIWMEDNLNHWSFVSDSIEVVYTPPPSPPPSPSPTPAADTTPPSYSDLIESADPLEIGNILIIRINVSDVSGINQVFIEFDGANHTMTYMSGNMWQYDSWNISSVNHHPYTIYMEDKSGNWNSVNDTISAIDTIPPLPPTILNCPEGEVNGVLIFDWSDGEDPSSILYYRFIIDTEANPFTTVGFIFEINITNTGPGSSYYRLEETLNPGTYYFFIYQIDGAGHQSNAVSGHFTVVSDQLTFLILIILVIGAVSGVIIGVIVLKKVKANKGTIVEKWKEEKEPEELEYTDKMLLGMEKLEEMNPKDLNKMRYEIQETIESLNKKKEYGKIVDYVGELINIESILGNENKVKELQDKQFKFTVEALKSMKEKLEKDAKNAAESGDISKGLELYQESKKISEKLLQYGVDIEILTPKDYIIIEPEGESDAESDIQREVESEEVSVEEDEIERESDSDVEGEGESEDSIDSMTYSCINALLTEIYEKKGIKYYSNIQINPNNQESIDGLILNDENFFQNMITKSDNLDELALEKLSQIRAIQIKFTEDISTETIINISEKFQISDTILIIVGINWPESEHNITLNVPKDERIINSEDIKVVHHDLFIKLMGIEEEGEKEFKKIVSFNNNKDKDSLKEQYSKIQVKLHDTDELKNDLREKGLIF